MAALPPLQQFRLTSDCSNRKIFALKLTDELAHKIRAAASTGCKILLNLGPKPDSNRLIVDGLEAQVTVAKETQPVDLAVYNGKQESPDLLTIIGQVEQKLSVRQELATAKMNEIRQRSQEAEKERLSRKTVTLDNEPKAASSKSRQLGRSVSPIRRTLSSAQHNHPSGPAAAAVGIKEQHHHLLTRVVQQLAIRPVRLDDLVRLLRTRQADFEQILPKVADFEPSSRLYSLKAACYKDVRVADWTPYTAQEREIVAENKRLYAEGRTRPMPVASAAKAMPIGASSSASGIPFPSASAQRQMPPSSIASAAPPHTGLLIPPLNPALGGKLPSITISKPAVRADLPPNTLSQTAQQRLNRMLSKNKKKGKAPESRSSGAMPRPPLAASATQTAGDVVPNRTPAAFPGNSTNGTNPAPPDRSWQEMSNMNSTALLAISGNRNKQRSSPTLPSFTAAEAASPSTTQTAAAAAPATKVALEPPSDSRSATSTQQTDEQHRHQQYKQLSQEFREKYAQYEEMDRVLSSKSAQIMILTKQLESTDLNADDRKQLSEALRVELSRHSPDEHELLERKFNELGVDLARIKERINKLVRQQ